MTTAVSTRRGAELPALAKPVPLSGSLAYHVGIQRPFGAADASSLTPEQLDADPRLVPHYSPPQGRPSRADVAEAVRKLVEAEHVCRPGEPVLMAVWCGRMKILPWGPTDERASQASITAICLACGDLPAAVWTAESATLALRRWKRWPAPAEVYALLSEVAKPFLRMRDGLRRVAATEPAGPAAAPKAPPTESELAYVGGIVSALTLDLAHQVTARELATPRNLQHVAKPLSDGQLLAAYEAAGPAGYARAELLRRKLAAAGRPSEAAQRFFGDGSLTLDTEIPE